MFASVHGGNLAGMAVSSYGVHIDRAGAVTADDGTNVFDGRGHRRRQLRHDRARWTADGPNGTQVRGEHVPSAHVRRMDVNTLRPSSETRIRCRVLILIYIIIPIL